MCAHRDTLPCSEAPLASTHARAGAHSTLMDTMICHAFALFPPSCHDRYTFEPCIHCQVGLSSGSFIWTLVVHAAASSHGYTWLPTASLGARVAPFT